MYSSKKYECGSNMVSCETSNIQVNKRMGLKLTGFIANKYINLVIEHLHILLYIKKIFMYDKQI